MTIVFPLYFIWEYIFTCSFLTNAHGGSLTLLYVKFFWGRIGFLFVVLISSYYLATIRPNCILRTTDTNVSLADVGFLPNNPRILSICTVTIQIWKINNNSIIQKIWCVDRMIFIEIYWMAYGPCHCKKSLFNEKKMLLLYSFIKNL